jgi:hypothetical protein
VLRAAMALGRKFIGCDIAYHKEDQTALTPLSAPPPNHGWPPKVADKVQIKIGANHGRRNFKA